MLISQRSLSLLIAPYSLAAFNAIPDHELAYLRTKGLLLHDSNAEARFYQPHPLLFGNAQEILSFEKDIFSLMVLNRSAQFEREFNSAQTQSMDRVHSEYGKFFHPKRLVPFADFYNQMRNRHDTIGVYTGSECVILTSRNEWTIASDFFLFTYLAFNNYLTILELSRNYGRYKHRSILPYHRATFVEIDLTAVIELRPPDVPHHTVICTYDYRQNHFLWRSHNAI